MEALLPAAAMAALLWKFVDLMKYLRTWNKGGKNGAVTVLTSWLGGILVVLLYGLSDWSGMIEVNGLTLDNMNLWSQLAAGLGLGGVASVGFDFKKAVDPSDSAHTPSLVHETPPAPRQDPIL